MKHLIKEDLVLNDVRIASHPSKVIPKCKGLVFLTLATFLMYHAILLNKNNHSKAHWQEFLKARALTVLCSRWSETLSRHFLEFRWNKRNSNDNQEMILVHKNPHQMSVPLQMEGGRQTCFLKQRLKCQKYKASVDRVHRRSKHPVWSLEAVCNHGKG